MTKRLSEIGTEVWPYLERTEEPKCYMLNEPAVESHTVEFLLTIEERRELLKEAIHRWEQWKLEGRMAGVSAFLKEQGL